MVVGGSYNCLIGVVVWNNAWKGRVFGLSYASCADALA